VCVCVCMCRFCNVWLCVCVGFVMCGCVCVCGFCNVQGVAIKKPDSCSNPLLKKKSENRNVIPFNVVPSPIPKPLHANFPLLEAVLQVILC